MKHLIFLRFPMTILHLTKNPILPAESRHGTVHFVFSLIGKHDTRPVLHFSKTTKLAGFHTVILEPWKTRVHFKMAQQIIYYLDKDSDLKDVTLCC